MKTLVLNTMPSTFWDLVDKNGLRDRFIEDRILFSEEIEIFIIRTDIYINESYFKRFPNLKLIIRAGSGVDNVDFTAAKKFGVYVCNTPNANVQPAYEHTISIILALLKQQQKSKEEMLAKRWKDSLEPNSEISDIKALVVGLGRIGKKVASFLTSHGAQVKAVDPFINQADFDDMEIEPISYSKGLKWCNLLTFHCPATSNTKHYFSKPVLKLLEQPIFLINVSRGNVVCESALEEGLKQGLIRGAGLDVFEEEPWQVKAFANTPNLLITPHTGAYTERAKQRLSIETLDVWKDFVYKKTITSEAINWDIMKAKR